MRKTIHWNCNCRLRNSAETCPSSCCHGSSLNQTASVNIHTWKNKSCYCVTISQYGYTCKQTTTYHNDTPGALPSWPWQLLLSANQWLIEVDDLEFGGLCCCVWKMSSIAWMQVDAMIRSIPVVFKVVTYRRKCHQLLHSCSFPRGHHHTGG